MAKKRKKGKEPEDEYEFRPPDFDEKEFIRKELRDSKAVIITVIYAIALGVAAGVVSALSRSLAGVAFILAFVGIFTLTPIYAFFNIDTKTFQKRNWAGNIGTFFFTFLAIWILLMNTPFTDHTKPVVSEVIVWVDDGTSVLGLEYKAVEGTDTFAWVPVNASLPVTIVSGSNQVINITAKVADNGNLRTIQIAIGGPTGFVDMKSSPLANRYEHTLPVVDLRPVFYISAGDSAGNENLWHPATPLPIS